MKKIDIKEKCIYAFKYKKEIGKSIIYGILLSFIITYMINASGLFSLGISGIAQGISYTLMETLGNNNDTTEKFIQVTSFWSLYRLMSIPIIIFTYFKHERKFFLLTMVMIVVNLSFGFIFPYIPGLKNTTFILESFGIASKEISRLALATIGGVLYGLIASLAFKQGGSTGGTDPIAKYLSREKGIEIGNFNLILSSIIIFTFLTLNDFIISPINGTRKIEDFFIVLFGPKTIGTILFAVSTNMMINYIYPAKKISIVNIDSKIGDKISKHLHSINWSRNFSISEIKNGKTNEKYYKITMVVNSQEVNELIEQVKIIDSKAFIVLHNGSNVIGGFNRKTII